METGTHALVCCFDDVRLGNREIENTNWKERIDEHLALGSCVPATSTN